MFALWEVRVDGGNGKELYGDDYADIYAINRLHYKAASQSTCDHVSERMMARLKLQYRLATSLMILKC